MLYKVYGSQKEGKEKQIKERKNNCTATIWTCESTSRLLIFLTIIKKKRNQLHEVDQNHLFSQHRKRKSNNNKDN